MHTQQTQPQRERENSKQEIITTPASQAVETTDNEKDRDRVRAPYLEVALLTPVVAPAVLHNLPTTSATHTDNECAIPAAKTYTKTIRANIIIA